MSTVREHLEAIRDLHGLDRDGWCEWCEYPSPCVDHRRAVEALAILDAAERATRLDAYGHDYARVLDAGKNPEIVVPDASPDPQDTNT